MTSLLRRFARYVQPASPWDSGKPIREELLSVERIEDHARSLAIAQPIAPNYFRRNALAKRLKDNATELLGAYRTIATATEQGRVITPAAEWLIDNYHLVEKQIREVRADLPDGYYRQLPKLANGPFKGYPRVLGLAWAFVAHADSRFDPEMLCRYVRAYQQVQPLTIGELWAISITIRIVLVENLRRMAGLIVDSYSARQHADQLADRLLGSAEQRPEPAPVILADLERMPLPDAFAVELVRRLRDQDPKVTPVLSWLDERLAAQGTTPDEVVREEHQRQGSGTVTVRNIITSMRSISDADWTELFERMSFIDDILASAGCFAEMDFPTRNLYRSAIEDLARGSHIPEIEVAKRAVAASRKAASNYKDKDDERAKDPGYHLLAGGRRAFEKAIGFQAPPRAWFSRSGRSLGIRGYVGAGATAACAILFIPLFLLLKNGIEFPVLGLLGCAFVVPAVDLSVSLVNWASSFFFGATLLPAMELSDGVPPAFRTVVAVPTLLTTSEAIDQQIERLEIHYLASPKGDLHFALLSDWGDARSEHCVDDERLLAVAMNGIARLNQKYDAGKDGKRFALLHRRRIWNESEQQWIGWERKRGKLHELNRLLRGATDTTYLDIDGLGPLAPKNVRYVLTLDSDTRLPRDAVRRLIGKMAHPLNYPRFDADMGRIVEGYAVLQPRVTPSLPVNREGSQFQRIFSSMNGIDPYGSAISDVYQDLYGEGSYAGKGIYDVDAFEAALADRVPDSTLLSHDLFEGIFARAGLASDVEVVEEFPARYDVASSRNHRWARGDWQLLPWIFGRGHLVNAARGRTGITAMGRWKMIDNLRRSLSAPSSLLALLLGWSLPMEGATIWTLFVLSTIVLPTIFPVVGALVPARPGVALRSHFVALGRDLCLAIVQSVLRVALLAHQACSMSDAIVRTMIRLLITRRHLLEWTTAAQAAIGQQASFVGFYRRMAGAIVVAFLALGVVLLFGTQTWALVVPFSLIWLMSPALALHISQSPKTLNRLSISEVEMRALRLVARKTWRFFETFVTIEDNMLPPDNFQAEPEALAHRTSPTNVGLYLLSVASARDFGWIGTADAIDRIEATLSTMRRLARFRGHFYNWYDTKDLRPLDPPYISTVDSGNLAGHLIAVAAACTEWAEKAPALATKILGIIDSLQLTQEASLAMSKGEGRMVTVRQLDEAMRSLTKKVCSVSEANQNISIEFSDWLVRADAIADISNVLSIESGKGPDNDLSFWAGAILRTMKSHDRDNRESEQSISASRLMAIATMARTMALEMEFGFLFDEDRKLLSIGYLAPEGKLDHNCYDLLASEARLASFLAIAKGDVPARHWFRLGRAVTLIGSGAALVSWSGSMFEYLMPSLIMRAPSGSLLEQTSRLVVRRQIEYGASLGVPWGISESAYNARDIELTYQYSNFGVPGLGLKRGLGANTVIAPYATALAAMVDPAASVANFASLAAAGAVGRYGFCEALDYTVGRVPEGKQVEVVGAFMAHHQGMTIVAIADALLDGAMRSRFHSDPIVQATELLLQERAPRDVALTESSDFEAKAKITDIGGSIGRRLTTSQSLSPATHLLSNGNYSVMITAAGSGFSRWGDIAITRWREDATCDDWGSYVYLRDVDSGKVWSAGFQPSGAEPDDCEIVFNEDRARLTRRDGSLTTVQEILVSAEDDAEVRRILLTNSGPTVRIVELTSYYELVLAPQNADLAHPAFSKLFVETEFLANDGALVATRRKRSPNEADVWVAALAVVDGTAIEKLEIETDRSRFVGRGETVRTAIGASDGRQLSGTVGVVLDPVFAMRRRLSVAPGATVCVSFWTMVASSRADVLGLIDKHRDTTAFERASTRAWTQAQVQLRHIGINAGEAGIFQRLAGHLLYATPAMRPPSDVVLRGAAAQSSLWALGISGDLPILLLRISDVENLDLAHQVLQAHEYFQIRRFAVDLVILNERASSYVQDLQIAIETLVRASRSRRSDAQPMSGRVFVLRADLMSSEARALLISVSRAVLVGDRGRLSDQLDRTPDIKALLTSTKRIAVPKKILSPKVVLSTKDLEFFNGLGGFSKDGREYVTILGSDQSTPAPWVNVIANPAFGFQVSTQGSGSTWSINSRENQLTPWSNDPVTDRSGEALYISDIESGDLWSATALPIRVDGVSYVTHHGRGYSRFTHTAFEIEVELVQFVPLDDSLKLSLLKLKNRSDRVRHLSVASYVEWVLGPSRQASVAHVSTEIDASTGAMFARNRWSASFGARVAFTDMNGLQDDWTGDRREFIGRNGTLASPEALKSGKPWSKATGAAFDPCGAMSVSVAVQPGESVEITVSLGQAENVERARALVRKYRVADLGAIQDSVAKHWKEILESIQVKTPDRSMDIMLNGWLLYQTIACRLWARSAFYQSSGAYGFRDQLQDGTALVASNPAMTREHLLRAAARQFVEGDVQHWWLPHSGQGVRTRISDDRAWLAYAAAQYVEVSGDYDVLDEMVSFLEGQKLAAGEHDSFFQPAISEEVATLFEHCARALDQSLLTGEHGIPLIGTGDWNDGMNRVGEGGKGESVWLGWLLYTALNRFAALADKRNEFSRAAIWRSHALQLQASLEREAWDGDWYRRGWYDDGALLGSSESDDCQIDSIAQSWAVISGAAEPDRAFRGMAAVERDLIRPEDGVALLFKPPFDKTALDPGYIKGYPPGIRENGGQYTHAALWSIMAFAKLGEGDKAASLFSMLNPINHAATRTAVHRYKVEPYVVAADIYAIAPHIGRGGWTWYTGSAAWMQRAGIESILGLTVQGSTLILEPCIPKAWPKFSVKFRYSSTEYAIEVENPSRISQGTLFGELDNVRLQDPARIPLADDGLLHKLRIVLGRQNSSHA